VRRQAGPGPGQRAALPCSLALCLASKVAPNLILSVCASVWQVIQVAIPRTPAPVNVSPPRRIGPDFQSGRQQPLLR
jgi:hypothetical protein